MPRAGVSREAQVWDTLYLRVLTLTSPILMHIAVIGVLAFEAVRCICVFLCFCLFLACTMTLAVSTGLEDPTVARLMV